MTTPRAPNAPNPYHRGELLPTVRVDHDGEDLGGQDHLIAQGNARERHRIESQRASRNLTNDFNAEDPNRYKNAPSTPTRGGSRKKKYGGAQDISTPPSTPPMSPRTLVPPGAPRRPTAREFAARNAEENIEVERPQPLELFPGNTRRGTKPAQGGASLKCGPKSVKRTDARGKAYCAKCNRNHVKTWDRFAKNYYCGFDPDAYSAQIKQSRRRTMGGKKTKRAKRSHKKTRHTHKKSKSRRKRR